MHRQISAGLSHSMCCTNGGTLFTFGEGTFGQLGNVKYFMKGGAPTASDSPLPSMVSITDHDDHDQGTINQKPLRVIQVACGDYHSACITADGLLFSWGLSSDGRLGHGESTTVSGSSSHSDTNQDEFSQVLPRPIEVFFRTKRRIQQVSCGSDHTLCIDDVKSAYSFGRGNYGALGLGDTNSRSRPIKIQQGNSEIKWKMVAAGAKHSLLLAVDGRVYSCGHGGNGRLGLGKYIFSHTIIL
jgi:alpha-tubulin suppressor-like RCC1 family protein